MKTSTRYSPEVRERAVRMVLEHEEEYSSQWAAIEGDSYDNALAETIIGLYKAEVIRRPRYARVGLVVQPPPSPQLDRPRSPGGVRGDFDSHRTPHEGEMALTQTSLQRTRGDSFSEYEECEVMHNSLLAWVDQGEIWTGDLSSISAYGAHHIDHDTPDILFDEYYLSLPPPLALARTEVHEMGHHVYGFNEQEAAYWANLCVYGIMLGVYGIMLAYNDGPTANDVGASSSVPEPTGQRLHIASLVQAAGGAELARLGLAFSANVGFAREAPSSLSGPGPAARTLDNPLRTPSFATGTGTSAVADTSEALIAAIRHIAVERPLPTGVTGIGAVGELEDEVEEVTQVLNLAAPQGAGAEAREWCASPGDPSCDPGEVGSRIVLLRVTFDTELSGKILLARTVANHTLGILVHVVRDSSDGLWEVVRSEAVFET